MMSLSRTVSRTGLQTCRYLSSYQRRLPMNTIVNVVPQQESWVVERFGKFNKILQPGLQLLLPLVDRISYVHSLKEIALEIPSQAAITQDNVTLNLDGVLYLKIVDPYKASYGVEDPEYAVSQLAQTTMRSEIGRLTLDSVFRERSSLNSLIVDSIGQAAAVWGITCLRYEIRDIQLPDRVVNAMQMQVAAERKKRATVLESEGVRESAINVAEGEKQSIILNSEAKRMEYINIAEGEASSILARAKATAESIEKVSESIKREGGMQAASVGVAEQYLKAFGNIAKEGNTMLLPANGNDPAGMVAQAMSIYGNICNKTSSTGQLKTAKIDNNTDNSSI